MKKTKKFFTSTFWVLANLAAIAVIIFFVIEEFPMGISRNIWLNISLIIFGLALIAEVPRKTKKIFKKIVKPNKFLKRMFFVLTGANINIISTLIIFCGFNGMLEPATGFKIEIFYAKITICIIFIINVCLIKKLLNKIDKISPTRRFGY